MARSKVILPPNSTGQNMGIATYSNGTDTVGASEVTLVDATGAQIPGDATNGLDVDVTRLPAITSANLEVPFTTTTAQAVATTDVSIYRWLSVQITSQGGSSLVTFQGSNDNTNWLSIGLINYSASASVTQTNTSATGLYHSPIYFRYFRLNVTGIASGTTAGVIEFSAMPSALQTLGVSAAQNGTWTVQPGNTANTTAWKVDGSAVTQPVSPPTLTKGTQGATGFSVQSLIDAGRTLLAFTVQNLTAGTSGTEVMASFSQCKGSTVTTGVTSYVVTSGKRFRMLGLQLAITPQAATVVRLLANIRVNTAGATITSSPLVAGFDIGGAAVIGQTAWANMPINESFEFTGDGTLTIGLSFIPTWTTTAAKVSITLFGYEY